MFHVLIRWPYTSIHAENCEVALPKNSLIRQRLMVSSKVSEYRPSNIPRYPSIAGCGAASRLSSDT
jgi:hypothetical protein